MRPTVAEIKVHSRIDNDIEDAYLQQLENSAYDMLASYLNRVIILDTTQELHDDEVYYNDQMKIAELMIIDSWYNDRSAKDIPAAALFILNQFRVSPV